MENNYFGILNDNTIIRSNSFDHLVKLKYIKFIIKKVIYDEYFDYYKNKNILYKYISVDKNEQPIPILVGRFEIIDLGPDEKTVYSQRSVLISENYGEKTHKVKFNYSVSEHFIEFELIPLIETLKLTNSIEIYLQLQKLKMLEATISKLEKTIEEKDNLILLLQSQSNETINDN